MALANLKYASSADTAQGRAFDVDLGTVNRYYQIAVGGDTRRAGTGISVLASPTHVSRIIGPVPDSATGRLQIKIPHDVFNRESFRVQLKSFRDQDLSGPALSDVVTTPRWNQRLQRTSVATDLGEELAALERDAQTRAHMMATVGYPYRPERGPVSEAMFLQALLGMLPKALPVVGNLMGGLFGGGKAPAPAASGPVAAAPGLGGPLDVVLKLFASNPEIQKVLGDLLGTLLKGSTAKSLSRGNASVALSEPGSYSEAMIAPAIMAILSQVLTPETMQAIVKAAPELIAATGKVLTEIGNVANKQVQQHLDHQTKIHNTDDATLERMLGPMSVARMGPSKRDLAYRRVQSVKLHFADVVPLTVGGQKRISYLSDRDLRFPLTVEAPRPLGQAKLELEVTHSLTNQQVYRRSVRLTDLEPGRIDKVPVIPQEVAAGLAQGEDYFVKAVLTWRSRAGEVVGTSRIQVMTPSAPFAFSDIERMQDPIALMDATRFREFWHRIWNGRLTDHRRRMSLEVKYVYGWAPESKANARTETLVRLEPSHHRKVEGMLKGGMLVSPNALNDLLPRLFDRPTLEPDELDAIRNLDFSNRFSGAARTKVTVKGRPGASASVWAAPEVALHRITLRRASQVDDNGHITAFEDRETVFPLPVAVHIVGTRSAS